MCDGEKDIRVDELERELQRVYSDLIKYENLLTMLQSKVTVQQEELMRAVDAFHTVQYAITLVLEIIKNPLNDEAISKAIEILSASKKMVEVNVDAR